MKIIKNTVDHELNTLEKSVFDNDTVFLDIETLGFSSRIYPIYLIGCMAKTDDLIETTLFFSERPDDEEAMLSAFLEYLTSYKTIITFNGDTFDLPYIAERCSRHHMYAHLELFRSMDLYKEVKKLKKVLSLPDLKLKTIERFLGIYREDKYSGGELIDVYKDYATCPSEEKEKLLLLHNEEDVINMLPVLNILAYKSLTSASLSDPSFEEEDPCHLLFSFQTDKTIPKEVRLKDENIYTIFSGYRLKGALTVYQGSLKYYYMDYKNYVYLIDEDIIVPKALSLSVPKESKRKAKKEECFSIKTGSFLPLPDIKKCPHPEIYEGAHSFRKDYCDKQFYILYEKNTVSENFLTLHIENLIISLTC
ncbi:MAG: ribonuclease H-like domain-containing protein [Lachnospiraceae bacterium]|nr:ribonuclease H-like domain-containing protein [Lachnospiraceae bacterium]